MLKRLYLDNCFTHFDQTFNLEAGLTGIIGPNESGKSLIVEMIRYALFGTKALRGKSEDYKKLHVELDFVVANVAYTVLRKGTKVRLSSSDQEVTGTKPVDEAIRSILGYDLAVFDVANACNQGNIEALSDMSPTARKAMVDKTVGLTALDDLIKLAGSEGNAVKREAEAMARGLIEPTPPVQPEGYRAASEILPELETAHSHATEYNQLKGFLSRTPREPAEPEAPACAETADQLRQYQDERSNLERSVQNIQRQLNSIEPEQMDEAALADAEEAVAAYDAWKQKERLLAQGHICCPECNHSWPVADLSGLEHVQEVSSPALSPREIKEHRARLGNTSRIETLSAQIEQLATQLAEMPDRSADLTAAHGYEQAKLVFIAQKKAWDDYNAELPAKVARYEELAGSVETTTRLRDELQAAQQYEHALIGFDNAQQAFEKLQSEVTQLELRAEEFLKAREIIKALKVSVKSHLLPSLNKVASVLLSQMTGGERYLVEVDDDFDILIDGQRIATLSGSGKAVANLAVRIALGQILTNRVFSVFMADEVDAAMDDDRASYTAQALRRLTEQVAQVITVTHKRPETDQTIELKK